MGTGIAIGVLLVVGYIIWRLPSQEQFAAKILAVETMIYREATVEEFRLLKEGNTDEKLVVTKDITERLEKAGKLSWKL